MDPKNAKLIDQEVLQKKIQAITKEIEAVQEKHGMILVPVLVPSDFGIFPSIAYMTKQEYERRTAQTQPAATPGPLAVS